MGFDLYARNKKAGSFSMGAFSWSWMLEQGVGLVVGHGKGIEPASFIYAGRPDGLSLGYNDGARVSAKEAKQMAFIAKLIADHQDRMHNEWEKLTEARQKQILDDRYGTYNVPVRKDFVDKTRAFAAFAEVSGGFRVR